MRSHREVIRDDDDLLIVAVQEIAAALGPIVGALAQARARFIVAEEIEQRDLVVRDTQDGQPTASELLVAVLAELERHACSSNATAAGAHAIARKVGRRMGVQAALRSPGFRRTRAEVDDAPNPARRREGTQGLVGGVLRGDRR